MKINVIIKLI